MRSRRQVAGVALCALAIALSGCGQESKIDPGPEGPPTDSFPDGWQTPSAEQHAAMADGFVTREEYELGFRAYQGCLERAGMSLIVTDVDADIIQYYGTVGNETADAGCYSAHFVNVDSEWQMAHNDLRPRIEHYVQCLQGHGIEPSLEGPDPVQGGHHRIRYQSLVDQAAAAGLDETCVPSLEEIPDGFIDPAFGNAEDDS